MKRKILSLIAGTMLCAPALSLAVGLGSVRTYSNLNERLKAEIPVLSVRQKGRMSVSLAPNAEFAKRGVQRSDVLDDLQFSVVERNGRTYVKVRSGRQISAPYLNFILQLHTKEGIVSREYAIFLDPASGKKRTASAVKKKSVVTSKSKQQATSTYKRPSRKAQPKPTVSRSRLPIANAKGGRYGPVREGETLWSIAAYSRPSTAVSVSDMVKAIRHANPRTLANGLQKETSLYIPTIQGYNAFSGGYAPMPGTVKNVLPATHQTKQVAPAKSANKKAAKKPAVKKPLEKQVYGNNKLAENLKPAEKKNIQVEADEAKNTATPLATADVTAKKINKPVLKVEEAAKETVSDVGKQATDAKELSDNAKNTVVESTEKAVDSVKETTNSAAEKLVKPVEKVAKEIVEKTEVAKQTVANTTEKVEGKAKAVVKAVTKPVEKEETKPAVKPVEKAEKKVAVKPKPAVLAESEQPVGFMGFVNDNLPLLGGGAAALAGLGGALYLRRKRQGVEGGTKDVVLLDDDANFSEGDSELTDSTFDDLAAATLLEELSEEEQQLAAIETNDEVLDDLSGLEDTVLADELVQVNDALSEEQQLDELLSDLDANFDESELDLLEQAESDEVAESGEVLPSLSELSDEANQFAVDDLNILAATNEIKESIADDIELVDESVNAPQPIPKMGNLSGFENNIELLSDDDFLDLEDAVASVKENTSAAAQEVDVGVLDEAIDLDDDFDFDEALQELDDEASNLADVDANLDEGLTFDLTDGVDTKETVASSASVSDPGADEMIDIEAGDGLSLDFDLSNKSEAASAVEKTTITELTDSEAVNGDDLALDDELLEADLVLNATTLSQEDAAKMQMKLDLANSFVSISQIERAKDLLEEVIKDGNSEQAELATKVLNDIS